jgi:hypothetical protein
VSNFNIYLTIFVVVNFQIKQLVNLCAQFSITINELTNKKNEMDAVLQNAGKTQYPQSQEST